MMQMRAFKMHLDAHQHDEYQRRHDAIWPDLVAALRQAGIDDYRIFLDADTHTLFAVMQCQDANTVDALPDLPVMQKWWDYMADIMASNADRSPVSTALLPVFSLASDARATARSTA